MRGCDHSAISVSLSFGKSRVGPGLWRCNPFLAQDSFFRRELAAFCDNAAIFLPPGDAPKRWDTFKARLKAFIQGYSNKAQARHHCAQKSLQQQRSTMLRRRSNGSTIESLQQMEAQLDALQDRSASILMLRAGSRWRESGERSNAYFYRTLRSRQYQTSISSLQSSNGELVDEPSALTQCAQEYYEQLYSPDPIDCDAIESLLSNIPADVRVDPASSASLLQPWTADDVQECLNRTPTTSSPGVDGIPYVILKLLFKHPFCRGLFLEVLRIALLEHRYLETWQRSVVVLLPKKGDRSSLKNWRPISLIGADAKVFTRLLANRVNQCLPSLIDQHQTGFMQGRFIADNGLCARLIMDMAKRFKIPGVGLLLDQEKAYDRVHPAYLQACLRRFGFPESFISCISTLFFQTSLCVNVNGFLSAPFAQGRGLRQGDPLSPLLFNLALEPLPRTLMSSSQLSGFRFLTDSTAERPILKSLAYADDILVFLSSPSELPILLSTISMYERASNARLNRDKTLAVSLSGEPQPDIQQALMSANIVKWHDKHSIDAAIYSG